MGINWCRLSNSNALTVSKSILCVSTTKSVIADMSIWSSAPAVAGNSSKSRKQALLRLTVFYWNSYKSWHLLFGSEGEGEREVCIQIKPVGSTVQLAGSILLSLLLLWKSQKLTTTVSCKIVALQDCKRTVKLAVSASSRLWDSLRSFFEHLYRTNGGFVNSKSCLILVFIIQKILAQS